MYIYQVPQLNLYKIKLNYSQDSLKSNVNLSNKIYDVAEDNLESKLRDIIFKLSLSSSKDDGPKIDIIYRGSRDHNDLLAAIFWSSFIDTEMLFKKKYHIFSLYSKANCIYLTFFEFNIFHFCFGRF
jgi:hypothetical protein